MEINNLKEFLNNEKIPFCLHESMVINYFITNKKIFLRLGVPCYLHDVFKDDDESNYFIIDFIAYEPKLIEYELSFLTSDLSEIIWFEYKDGKYDVLIYGSDNNRIVFTAEKSEWIPLKKVNSKDFDNITDCDYRYIEFP